MNTGQRNFSRIFVIAVASGSLVYSCGKKYLDKEALGMLDENVLATSRGVETLLIGAYSLLDGISYVEGSEYNNAHWGSACSNWVYGSVCGTEAYKGGSSENDQSDVFDLETFDPLPGNSFLAAKWRAVYDGIQRCNDVLRIMKKARDITPENEKRISAEARFLRAHYHFEAKKIWNNVPFVDENISYENQNYHVTNQENIWPFIETDLRYAVNNLKENPYGDAVGRANKFTAMALLAKAYLFQSEFDKARPLLDSIINSGKYQLLERYADNFDSFQDKLDEAIFTVQMSVRDKSMGYNGNYGDVMNFPNNFFSNLCCSFFQPSQYLVNHFLTDANGLPDLSNNNTTEVKNDEGYAPDSAFIPESRSLDSRLDWTVGRRGIPYLDWGNHPGTEWIANQKVFGPYNTKKNAYYKAQQQAITDDGFWVSTATANNVNLIRYAEVLLWAAEVEAETGTPDKARIYVNMIRERAANAEGWVRKANGTPAANYKVGLYVNTWTDREQARKAVRFERMLELAMEGHRFFDLVRWKIADTEIRAYLNKEKFKRKYLKDAIFDKGINEYFPIPQTQIDLSTGADGVAKMIQNPGY